MKSKRFNELDIVRGFAACWVVGVHFWLFNVIPAFLGYKDFFEYIKAVGEAYSLEKFFPLAFNTPGNIIFDCLNTFFLLGYQGVHIFFVISGFGLTYSQLLKSEEKWFSFLKKKFSRIYPTYWVILIFSMSIPWIRAGLFYGYFDIQSLWRSFFLLDKAIPFTWFMCPLIQFYLVFFILFKCLKRYSISRFLTTAFLASCLYTLLILMLSYSRFPTLLGDGAYPGYLAISRAFEFCLGMALAKVYVNDPHQLISYLVKPSTIGLAIICEIIGILGSFKFTNEITFLGYIIPLGISFYNAFLGFGIFVIVFNLSRLIIHLSEPIQRLFLFISGISYELYLTHFIALMIASKLFTSVVSGESSFSTAFRSILVYILVVKLCIVAALTLQMATMLITNLPTNKFIKMVIKH